MIVKLYPKDYKYSESLPVEFYPAKKVTREIDTDDIETAAKRGVSWTQLSAHLNIDETTLQKHFYIYYMQARAMLEINVLSAMVDSALDGNPQMQKWLSSNWLGMTERTTPIVIQDERDLDVSELDNKIARLQNKLSKK